MRSLWKDLLFLHGHMAHANLIWSELDTSSADHDTATAKQSGPGPQACTAACCVAVALPRIVAPR